MKMPSRRTRLESRHERYSDNHRKDRQLLIVMRLKRKSKQRAEAKKEISTELEGRIICK